MKVNVNLTVINGQKQASPQKAVRAPNRDPDVSSARPKAVPENIVEVVSLENRRAVSEMPRSQDEVERLLQQAKVSLSRMTKDELRKLHRLEGLVQVFLT